MLTINLHRIVPYILHYRLEYIEIISICVYEYIDTYMCVLQRTRVTLIHQLVLTAVTRESLKPSVSKGVVVGTTPFQAFHGAMRNVSTATVSAVTVTSLHTRTEII